MCIRMCVCMYMYMYIYIYICKQRLLLCLYYMFILYLIVAGSATGARWRRRRRRYGRCPVARVLVLVLLLLLVLVLVLVSGAQGGHSGADDAREEPATYRLDCSTNISDNDNDNDNNNNVDNDNSNDSNNNSSSNSSRLEAPFPSIEVMPWRCKLRDGATGRPRIDPATGGELYDAEDHLFALDNRRLYCLQKAAAAVWPARVLVDVVELPPGVPSSVRQLKKFRTLNRGQSILICGDVYIYIYIYICM